MSSFEELETAAVDSLTLRESAGPSQDDVRLGDVIDDIQKTLMKYIDFEHPVLAMVITLWIVQTFCFQSFQYCGYLALRSPTPRCGKSRLLKLIALFTESVITTIPTPATLFRSPRATLILDEVDMLGNRDKETFGIVLAVLNFGFEKGATIQRCEKEKGGGFKIQDFPVYGPKAIAGIESLADTLADRCFQIPMQRTSKRLPRLNLRKLQPEAENIRNKIRLWLAQKTEPIEALYEDLPDELPQLKGLDDRLQDISEPLVVLAGLADEERGKESSILQYLLEGLKLCAGRREPSGREQNMVAFLGLIEEELGPREEAFFPTSDLLPLCADHEDLSWLETAKRLANFLKNMDLSATVSPTGKKRGYWITRTWVGEWNGRYSA